MRVVIFAFDGLDYQLACKHLVLRQEECGWVNVSEPLETAIVWASFITGLHYPEHGVREGTPQREARIKEGVKTIFDYARRPIALWVPGYNPHPEYWNPKDVELTVKAIADPKYFPALENRVLSLFAEQRNIVWSYMYRKDWDLLMAHFNLIDALGHVIRDYRKMEKYLPYLSDLILKCWEVTGTDPPIRPPAWKAKYMAQRPGWRVSGERIMWLFVSDHGVDHKPHAFYSCNLELGLEEPDITDFFEIIIGKLRE